jgi:2,5-dichloro-2,5-cyclohexadiene-1,4-diol dehydrogenase 1
VDRALYIEEELAIIPGLQGKSILVTGSSSGIGRSASLILARSGAKLTLADTDEAGETENLICRAAGVARFVRTDVACEQSVQNAVAVAVAAYGRLDGAFNNAGIPQIGAFHETSGEEFQQILDINLAGVFYCMKHEIVGMLKIGGGAIVNTSSLTGISAFGDNAAYCASKFGVVGLTMTAAHDYGDRGIRANVVCPGATETPQLEIAWRTGRMAQRMKQTPFGRAGTPREMAQAAAWLLSDGASYISGVVLPVDGGFMAGPYYRVED